MPGQQRYTKDDSPLHNCFLSAQSHSYWNVVTNQPNTTSNTEHGRSLDRSDPADVSDAQAGAVQSAGAAHFTDWERHCAEHGFDIRVADAGWIGQSDRENNPTEFNQDATDRRGRYEFDQIFRRGQVIEADGEFAENNPFRSAGDDERTENAGLDTVETQTEMGGGWSDIAVNGLYVVANLAMIGGMDNDKPKSKYVRERKHGQKKKKQDEQSQDEGYEMKM